MTRNRAKWASERSKITTIQFQAAADVAEFDRRSNLGATAMNYFIYPGNARLDQRPVPSKVKVIQTNKAGENNE